MDTPWTDEYRKAIFIATVAENPFIPFTPHPKQTKFLLLADVEEILFGGAAGPGKSSSLLMGALQFVTEPGYAAIIFRKSFKDLALPGALMSKAQEWLSGTKAKWNDDTKTWTFPSGATLTFAYLDNVNDKYNYASAEFQYIAFDELTQFKEEDYLFLFSRLRRLSSSQIPLRMRGASNPGGTGHAWVKMRFITKPAGQIYIPALKEDNPSLDQEAYDRSLIHLPSRVQKQLKEGSWEDFAGQWFRPVDWPIYIDLDGGGMSVPWGVSRRIYPYAEIAVFIGVDWATSEKKTADYTAFVVGGLTPDGQLLILDVLNRRINMEQCPSELAITCQRWRPVCVSGEDDVLSKSMVLECRRMPGIPEIRRVPIGSKAKLIRWTAAITQAGNRRVLLPKDAIWRDEFTDQLLAVTGVKDPHDDMADAFGVLCRVIDGVRGTGNDDDDFPEMLVPGKSPEPRMP